MKVFNVDSSAALTAVKQMQLANNTTIDEKTRSYNAETLSNSMLTCCIDTTITATRTDDGIAMSALISPSERIQYTTQTDAHGNILKDAKGNVVYTVSKTEQERSAEETASRDAQTERLSALQAEGFEKSALKLTSDLTLAKDGDVSKAVQDVGRKLGITDPGLLESVGKYSQIIVDNALGIVRTQNTELTDKGLAETKFVFKANDQSDSTSFLGRVMDVGEKYYNVLNPPEGVSRDDILSGKVQGHYETTLTQKGKDQATALAAMVVKGEDVRFEGLSGGAVDRIIMEGASPATAAMLLNSDKGKEYLAIRAYDPRTSDEVVSLIGQERTNALRSEVPLTYEQIQGVGGSVLLQGVKELGGAATFDNTALNIVTAPAQIGINLGIGGLVKGAIKVEKAANVLDAAIDAAKLSDRLGTVSKLPTGGVAAHLDTATTIMKPANGGSVAVKAAPTTTPTAKLTQQLTRQATSLNPMKYSNEIAKAVTSNPTGAANALAEMKLVDTPTWKAVEDALPSIAGRPNVQAVVQEATRIADDVSIDVARQISNAPNQFIAARNVIEGLGIAPTLGILDNAMRVSVDATPLIARAAVDEVLARAGGIPTQTADLARASGPGILTGVAKFEPLQNVRITRALSDEMEGVFGTADEIKKTIAGLPLNT